MLQISFLQLEITFFIIWHTIRVFACIKNKKFDFKKEIIFFLLYLSFAAIIRFTFFPMAMIDGKIQPLEFNKDAILPFRINLIPFIYLLDYDNLKELLLNVIGNATMFIPVGILLPIAFKRLDCFSKVVGAGFLISLFNEILQLPFFDRASDIDDLTLNTLGVIIGYAIFRGFTRRKNAN